jgi:hypothetical protein
MHRESRDSEFVKSRLQSGGATGATRFKTLDGAGDIRVRVGERGRGLFAVSLIKKGEPIDSCAFLFLTLRCCTGQIIAQGSGKLVSTPDDAPGCHHYEWFDKRVFVFDPPSVGNLAVLVNTPVSMVAGAVSNARYSRIRRTIKMRVRCPRQADNQNDTFCRWLQREPSNPVKRFSPRMGWGFLEGLGK